MSSGGGSKGESNQSTQVQIPDFLQPFLQQATGAAGSALGQVQGLAGQDQVADLTPQQLQALGMAEGTALGDGGFFDTAQQTFLDTAQGQGLESFLNPSALAALTGATGGGLGFIPPAALEALNQGTSAGLPDFLQQSVIPGSVSDTLSSGSNVGVGDALPDNVINLLSSFGNAIPGTDTLERLSNANVTLPQESLDALSSTAQGDFLFGGEGFDQAVQAAMRAAQPGINSVFGRTAGGADSGLAQTALGTAGIDAFARQFGQERSNQLGAANSLADLVSGTDLANRGLQAGAASNLANFGLAGRGQDIGAASQLGNLSLADAGLRSDVGLANRGLDVQSSGLLGNLNLSDANLRGGLDLSNRGLNLDSASRLAGIGDAAANRSFGAGSTLAGLSDAERQRQLGAAGVLPDIGMLDSQALFDVGSTLQGQQQRELSGPFQQQLQALMAALSGLPIQNLLGADSSGNFNQFGLGFGGE